MLNLFLEAFKGIIKAPGEISASTDIASMPRSLEVFSRANIAP
jgi:hypothetical protein